MVNINLDEKAAKKEALRVECPYCHKILSCRWALNRHIEKKHPEKELQHAVVKSSILKAIDKVSSISELFSAIGEFVEDGDVFKDDLPEEVVNRLREEDAKVQILLRVFALAKTYRIINLLQAQEHLDQEILRRVSTKSSLKKMAPSEVINYIDTVRSSMNSELKSIEEILKLGKIDMHDLAGVLSDLVTPLSSGNRSIGGVKSLTYLIGDIVSSDPAERENVRKKIMETFKGVIPLPKTGKREKGCLK